MAGYDLNDHLREHGVEATCALIDGTSSCSANEAPDAAANDFDRQMAAVARPTVQPLFDPAEAAVDAFLDRPPPDRKWLLRDVLPLSVVGLLAAGGGTGKSMLTLQLAVSVASGRPFLGIEVDEPGGVLVIAGEDEREELHRRVFRIVQVEAPDDSQMASLRERLFIKSCVGADNRLTAPHRHGGVRRTDMADRIIGTAAEIPNLRLIVIDPVSRFRGGEENSSDDATRFVEAVETIRAATGATVLLPHHVSKEGLRAGAERLSVEGIRGASGLVDGVRWAGAMATLRRDVATQYGIDLAEAGNHVRLDVVKSNYAAPWPGMWLRRQPGGPLVVGQDLIPRSKAKAAAAADDRYADVSTRVANMVRKQQEAGAPLNRNKLRGMAGLDGVFGVGDKTLRGVVDRMIEEGEIREHDTGNCRRGKELRTW